MTKQATENESLLFVISTVGANNGEILYYVANNQSNSSFTTGNTGTVVVSDNSATVNLTVTSDAVFATDFTLQIRRNSIFGPLLRESANIYLVPPPEPTHGWFGGGSIPALISSVDRIDFAADTNTATARGPLSETIYLFAAAGNDNYGWFAGGLLVSAPSPSRYRSRVNRITFAADTNTASVRGSLSVGRSDLGAMGNDDFGWFGAGFTTFPAGATFTRIDRINFAADTDTASVRGPLSSTRYAIAGVGNDDYGWFVGGGNQSWVDRVDFAADTDITSVRGPLSAQGKLLTATGNNNYGWVSGRFPGLSTVDRINYSDDTSIASVRGPLSLSRYQISATGNNNYGWFAGGHNPNSTVDRIDFADDTTISSVRGPLSVAKRGHASTSGFV